LRLFDEMKAWQLHERIGKERENWKMKKLMNIDEVQG
jgi:hypothetical protein